MTGIDELLPLVRNLEGAKRYMEVERQFKPEIYSDEIQLDDRTGIEKVRAPAGSLGLRLDKNHKVLEVLPTSPLRHKIYCNDQVMTLNDSDVTKVESKQFVDMLLGLGDKTRVLGVKRAPHSPRQVVVPPMERVGLKLRDNTEGGYVDCLDLLKDSLLQGKVFPGDRIRGANCRPVKTIQELMQLMKDDRFRVLTVETPDPELANHIPMTIDDRQNRISSSSSDTRKHALEELASNRRDASIQYKTVGQEIFLSIIAPPGKLGLKLNKKHEVVDLLSTSPLAGKVHLSDRVISIDEVDVRGRDPSSLVVLLMASQNRTRVIGLRRRTGKKIMFAVSEPRKRTLNERNKTELEERFPNLSSFGVPMGNIPVESSTRCKLLSELLSFNESIGSANDIETESGGFCHLVKIPKRGLGKKNELRNSLDDVIASLASICGDEIDAADLLLEFLANRSPSSYIKHSRNVESRPAKKRKIDECKIDPGLDPRAPLQNGELTTLRAQVLSDSSTNPSTSGVGLVPHAISSTEDLAVDSESKMPPGNEATTERLDIGEDEAQLESATSSTNDPTPSYGAQEPNGDSLTAKPFLGNDDSGALQTTSLAADRDTIVASEALEDDRPMTDPTVSSGENEELLVQDSLLEQVSLR